MSYYQIPTLLVRLNSEGAKLAKKDSSGYYNIDKTRVTLEQGLVFAEVNWGVEGTDMPVSDDISKFVTDYIVCWDDAEERLLGIYELLGDDGEKNPCAKANVSTNGERHSWFIKASERTNALALFHLLRRGEIRPADEYYSRAQELSLEEKIDSMVHWAEVQREEIAALKSQVAKLADRNIKLVGLASQMMNA